MTAFLLTWNPEKWEMDETEWLSEIRETASGMPVKGQWSTGGRRSGIAPGDTVYLLRQGVDRRGIVSEGVATSEVFQQPHWDGSGRLANYVTTEWHTTLDIDDRLPTEELVTRLPDVPWNNLQSSGVMVPEGEEGELARVWADHLRSVGRAQ